MARELTLYCDAKWVCPSVFHAFVALEEKQLTYTLETLPADVNTNALFTEVPLLVHGNAWLTDSLVISEYLAERFPIPGNPRIFPADLVERARARQIMSWLRSSLTALRAERPTSNVFGRSAIQPLTAAGMADAAELLRVASAVVKLGAAQMFGDWSIADADLALALMRLIRSDDPVPDLLIAYASAQWRRSSIQRYVALATHAS